MLAYTWKLVLAKQVCPRGIRFKGVRCQKHEDRKK